MVICSLQLLLITNRTAGQIMSNSGSRETNVQRCNAAFTVTVQPHMFCRLLYSTDVTTKVCNTLYIAQLQGTFGKDFNWSYVALYVCCP